MNQNKSAFVSIVSILFVSAAFAIHVGADESVSFNRDVLPVLAGKCFACHGPDDEARQADLRLDDRQEAIDFGAIQPGDANGSELIARILSEDPELRMPPPEAGGPLNDVEIKTLSQWVDEGAAYTPHWAFVRPQRTAVPSVQNQDWVSNPIDAFVLQQLESEGLSPSPDADRATLVRRVYLDLIGIPPTPQQANAFIANDDPLAYEQLVDQLLQSPHYGQRWATPWLDLVRYADTNGYEKDRPRSIWPYRDWVIRALNDDMPFDQFSIQQIAGDMLPEASESQRIATGMHRNTMLNEEGGIDPLEYRFYAMVDRVATTGIIWMGLTTGCAQCHTHKYDPITHTDYYRLMALMNNADEPDLILTDDTITGQRDKLQQQIVERQRAMIDQFPAAETKQPGETVQPTREQRLENLKAQESAWISQQQAARIDWQVIRPVHVKTNLPRLEVLDDGSIFATGDTTKRDEYQLAFEFDQPTTITALRLEALPDDRLPARGPGMAYYEGRKGDFFLSELSVQAAGEAIKMRSGSVSYGKLSVGGGAAKAENVYDSNGSTGWSASGREGQRSELVLNVEQPFTVSGLLELKLLFERHFVAGLGRFRISITQRDDDAIASDLPATIVQILSRDRASWSEQEQRDVRDAFLAVTPLLAEARKPIDALRKRLAEYPATMIMRERPADNPRVTHRHHRGEYLSPREEVSPMLPSLFANTQTPVTDRLKWAQWLVSDNNPLVGRVTVNRAWRAFFGAGLVRTSGDFGTQSDPPTHPDLIDWLAVEFTQGGNQLRKPWSMKKLHRLIVTSRTYRQDSAVNKTLLERDRDNRLLARGPRFRVDAEMVRDMMLAASGLLSDKMLGPSVYPPQPESVTALSYGAMKWNPSEGADRYRRSLYTFSKRTAPFASFAVFDGPTGENCLARRNRSNTPLQALTLLNDAMYVEMAIALAADVCKGNLSDPSEIATLIYRRVLTRSPSAQELRAILEFQAAQLLRIKAGELQPDALVDVSVKGTDQAAEQASWTLVARAIMNLDEAITK